MMTFQKAGKLKGKVKQFFAPYWDWEDYKNGMYSDCSNSQFDKMISSSVLVLTNTELFLSSALKMIEQWQTSANVNLSNPGCNKKAWIGQATCCFVCGSNEKATRQAWGKITEAQRNEANKVAKKVIIRYEEQNRSVHQRMGI